MKSKIYTKQEIEVLQSNPFVLCVEKFRFIKYDNMFKLWCIIQRKKHPEKTCKEIFLSAGFEVSIMNPKLPQARIKSWENTFYRFGYEYFVNHECYCTLKEELLINKTKTEDESWYLRKTIYQDVFHYIESNYDRYTHKD